MAQDNSQVLKHWNDENEESMYDKNLLKAEIDLIKCHIADHSKILDAGCGEGEGTLAYSAIAGVEIHAADFSETRLKKAAERLGPCRNVILKQVDFSGDYSLDTDYDVIVSQRFLINLMEWELQKRVLLNLMLLLRPGGRLIMLEGSRQGAESLNELRRLLGLPLIPVKWHNLFMDDEALVSFMLENKFRLSAHDGLGTYFLLTRGIRPFFDKDLDWNCEFNRMAGSSDMRNILGLDNTKFSRLKLWIFEK